MPRPTDIQNEAVWTFPMRYPLKVLGESQFPMAQIVSDIVKRHIPDFDPATVEMRASSGGRYVSITAVFTLTCKEQVNALYADLAACQEIKLVL